MIRLQRAVFFMEEEPACPADSKPLMLKAVLSCPILSWMSNQLLADGVQPGRHRRAGAHPAGAGKGAVRRARINLMNNI